MDNEGYGQIVAFRLNKENHECLIVVEHKDIIETYMGNYSKRTTYRDLESLSVLHFDSFLMLMENSPQTIEIEELDIILENLISHDFIYQLKDDQFPRTVRKAKELFSQKTFVGMKASLDKSFNVGYIDIMVGDMVFEFIGKVEELPFIDDKGLFCFKVSEKDEFLSHLLDDRLVDMTTVVSFDNALRCMKWISKVLIVEQGWECDNVVDLLNLN
jgi:hypothetical protein